MNIGGPLGEGDFTRAGQAVVVCAGAIPGHMYRSLAAGLLDGGGSPCAREQVVGFVGLSPEEVHRHHRELEARAPLEKHDLVVWADGEEFPQAGDGFLEDPVEGGAAVADFKHRHPDAGQGQHLVPRLLQHRQGQHSRAGGEIKDAVGHRGVPESGNPAGRIGVRRRMVNAPGFRSGPSSSARLPAWWKAAW